jgi:site-specific DNA recombinase
MRQNMASRNSNNGNEAPKTNKALSYARVSSKEQEKEGFSIAAQQKLLQTYALEHNLLIAKEFVDVETTKATGRASFTEMLQYLKKHPFIRTVLVEKTDRPYRNLKDWVTLDELDIEIHLIKEGITLSRDSRSSEKFVHGIKVLMAKNYIDNLSEEARKGQMEKAEQGIWPTKAPLGYRNVLGPEGKRIIALDPDVAPIVTKMFAWYAPGARSMKEIAEKARGEGLIYRRTGAAVPVSAIHTVLRNRIYTGDFIWKGRRYRGRHEPLISVELYERVQEVIEGRISRKKRRSKREFAFSTLITCGHCGCAMVGELKKRRYVYYHCTGYKGKCPKTYVREEVLSEKFSEMLGCLHFSDEVLQLVSQGLRESHVDEAREHQEAVARLQAEYDRLQSRLHAIYIDKLDGRIDNYFFDKLSGDFRLQQDSCLRQIARHQDADQSYLEEGIGLLEMARSTQRLFENEQPLEKRRLLNFVLSNSSWKDGELRATFRQPFDLIAETAVIAARAGENEARKPTGRSGWLGDKDSNLD